MATFESVLNSINSVLDEEMNLFNMELKIVLSNIEELVSIAALEQYATPLEFDYQFSKILNESGYNDLISNLINESYDKNYANITALFESSGLMATFTPEDIANIKAIKQLDLDFFRDTGNKASSKLKGDLFKYSLSGLDSKTMLSNIKASLADTDLVKYSWTYAETSISNFNQSLIDLKSEGLKGEVYVYGDILDKKTRDFCRCLVKDRKYYDKSDAAKIKSDKRRQYNCRHYVSPLSLDYALSVGFTAGTFSC